MNAILVRQRERLRVFLADDSQAFIERLAALVSDLPEVELVGKAGDVPGAVKGIRDSSPDAVIVDLHMPGGTGMDVIDAAKRARPAPAVIVLSNSSYAQYRTRCQAAGADAFFDKSTEFDRLPGALVQLSEGFRQSGGAQGRAPLRGGLPGIRRSGHRGRAGQSHRFSMPRRSRGTAG